MARSYAIYDVFTGSKLAGNPLAVVFDGEGLNDDQMQKIAIEFNLSETVFVLPAQKPAHTASLRIFTPGKELPFAGHPTVGTAIALAERNGEGTTMDMVSVLEEKAGPVRCAIKLREGETSFAELDLPKKAEQHPLKAQLDKQGLADALSINIKDIGFENYVPQLWSAGVPFLIVPIKDLGVLGEIDFDPAVWERIAPMADGSLASAYAVCRGQNGISFQARMFANDMGIVEDPATGSAAAAFSGMIHQFDGLVDGHHAFAIAQGIEMGRPSAIHLHVDVTGGEISGARIGGEAVRIASGTLEL
ncbi:PhzF family phenazine biosynthesis protein [Rhizobium sp. L1K21]|uniref:PhzF family phenazine biosynthesis protein n=1 Tax=Rhizobium sp. L1K21 TaxID=2954933 RepID=UPI002092A9C6|nr:PhzF family phenazine biosynthesis protein [Rhizobium sp. L1K21]MCO6185735.1 PhzF family phenazine biosynthesis protein [Rhizobium sp. L1K21]